MTPPHHADPHGCSLAAELRGLATLLETPAADCPDSVKRQRVVAVARALDRVEAAAAGEVGVFDANTVWAGDGARSARSWLVARTELSNGHAGTLVWMGRALRSCPQVEAAWASGQIGTEKAKLLLKARDADPDRFANDEADLVGWVVPLTLRSAAKVLDTWAALAAAAKEAEAQEGTGEHADDSPPPDPAEDNKLFLSATLGGRVVGDFDLDPVTGAMVKNAVAAEVDRRFKAGVYRADDGISAARRRADVMAELILRGVIPGQTKHGEPRPSVSVTIDHRTLHGLPVEDLDDAASRSCCLEDGTPVSRATAERLLCTARVSALLIKIESDGAVETLGTTELLRDATARQRKALRLRDGGCVFPGCDAPFDWCEAHHLLEWEEMGKTLLPNLVLLCRHHHHLVHEGGWRLWREPRDDQLYLVRPDGTPVAITRQGDKCSLTPPVGPHPTPPPRQAEPRFLTKRERAELNHRRQQHRRPD